MAGGLVAKRAAHLPPTFVVLAAPRRKLLTLELATPAQAAALVGD